MILWWTTKKRIGNYCWILTKAGYEVVQAADGFEALSLLQKSKIELVISDIFNAGYKWVCTSGSAPC